MAVIAMLGRIFLLSLVSLCLAAEDWPTYHGSAANTKYSTLDQINTANVSRLKLAWTYDTGDAFPGSEMQCNPIIINGVMYVTSPKLRILALDAATGKDKWRFDPNEDQPVHRQNAQPRRQLLGRRRRSPHLYRGPPLALRPQR
ncbi:MAG: hypothetical protein QM757_40995 [Paludibaculum sp.]